MHLEQLEARLLALSGKPAEVYDGAHHWKGELIAGFYPYLNLVECSLCLYSHPLSVEFTARQVRHIAGNIITLSPSSNVEVLSTIPRKPIF